MKPEHYKPRRKEKPRRKGSVGGLESQNRSVSQKSKPIASQKLREAYSTKVEWVKKRLPHSKKEMETPEEK
jgi:hypothetical protein